jgi:hypothetical protein
MHEARLEARVTLGDIDRISYHVDVHAIIAQQEQTTNFLHGLLMLENQTRRRFWGQCPRMPALLSKEE